MNPRERWQTLQSHLSAARGALAAGNRTTALEHIEAALAIDPEFLAARMLRDRVMSPEPETPNISSVIPSAVSPAPRTTTAAVSVSPEKLASFEDRVMQRVRDREAAAARSDIAKRQRWRIGVQLAAAAVFLTAVSSTALYEPTILASRSLAMSARLIDVEDPAPISVDDVQERAAATTADEPLMHSVPTAVAVTAMVAAPPEPVREATALPPPTRSPSQPTLQQQPATPPAPRSVQMLPPRPMPDATVASSILPSSAPAVVPALLVSTVDDRSLVDQTLQRYRRAYNRLDAQSAQAVYPAVNAGALARAFESLESQSLSFDSCDMDLEVQAHYAMVTCHGSSRYVPKIGNHVPRVEPRIWQFTLRKDDGDWKIENARAVTGR